MFRKTSKHATTTTNKRKGTVLINQMGLDMSCNLNDIEAMVYGDDDDDEGDLEAELAALTGESLSESNVPEKHSMQQNDVNEANINALVSRSMRDVNEDVSDTDDDPELLVEVLFGSLSHTNERLLYLSNMAVIVLEVKALSELAALEDEKSTVRQSVSTSSNEQTPQPHTSPPCNISHATASSTPLRPGNGADRSMKEKSMCVAETLPVVTVLSSECIPDHHKHISSSNSHSSLSLNDVCTRQMLLTRKEQYCRAALVEKKAGNLPTAAKYAKITKQFDSVLQALEDGRDVDLSNMPPPLSVSEENADHPQHSVLSQSSAINVSSSMAASVDHQRTAHETMAEPGAVSVSQESSQLSEVVDRPKSVMIEALTECLEKYKYSLKSANAAGDGGKARRMGRIVKQYDEAIKSYKTGNTVNIDELPKPPGLEAVFDTSNSCLTKFDSSSEKGSPAHPPSGSSREKSSPALPPSGSSREKSSPALPPSDSSREKSSPALPPSGSSREKSSPALPPSDSSREKSSPAIPPSGSSASITPLESSIAGQVSSQGNSPKTVSSGHVTSAVVSGSWTASPGNANIQKSTYRSRQELQVNFLLERMGEFRSAALKAKKNNDLELAKHYIRVMKGLEPMVNAHEAGLPVDFSQVPPSPVEDEDVGDKFVIMSSEDCEPCGDRETVFKKLEQDLNSQILMCVTNAQHFTKLGDIPSSSKFKKMESSCRKDLDSLKSVRRHGDPVPKFHYEMHSFAMVQCNTELGDGDLEVSIVRAISLNVPAGYTERDMDTYVKYELAYPADAAQIGHTQTMKSTANPEFDHMVKVQFDRKSRGFVRFAERKGVKFDLFLKRGFFKGDKLLGSATVKLSRLDFQCSVHECFDWMEGRKSVGGKVEVKLRVRDPFKGRQVEENKEKWLVIDQFIHTASSTNKAGQSPCITCLKGKLNAMQTQSLRHKSALLEEKLELQQKKLREGSTDALEAYVIDVEREVCQYETEAKQLMRVGDLKKAKTIMKKYRLSSKELTEIKAKVSI